MNKLYRSQKDKKLFGLCGGLAETLNVDATLLRLVVIITAIFSGGTVILLYIVASMVIPKEPGFDTNPSQLSYGHQSAGAYQSTYAKEPPQPNIDEMMKDIEKKAMWKEIEELRNKLSKYEKGEN